ncbi:uncharacterized protein LOC125657097 [Ostrea edulis]|uniref:uncharacterized protein LOC125657097 n=1 Tax=Ostrea edulis TaxID=37623 RepID=UPI0024AF8D13|nr:uncharacterized protein LOC125657097 [Ostrea edulis]
MDPRRSAQGVVQCDLCETAIVQMYCDFCHVNLCFDCIGKHIADDYDKHKVVPFQNRKSTLIYPNCSTHQNKYCKYHCKECDKSVCTLCTDNLLSSSEHKDHTFLILSKIYNKRKADITKDSEEIENIISPTYEEMATDLETQVTNLDGEYVKFTTVVTKHGEEWHKEIDYVINKMKNEIEEMKIKHLEILKKHLDEIKQIQSLIEQSLITLKEMEESNEVSVTMEYRSQNKEFRKLPPKVRVSLPTFNPNMIDSEQLYKSLGSLIPLSFTTDENGYTLKKSETLLKELMDEPELVTTINTGYEKLRSVTCLSEEEFWTSRSLVSDMKCFNVQGTVFNTIKTKSGESPNDIAVTSDGDLVYCDRITKTVNKVKSGQTEEVIRLQGWTPVNLCVTSSGDILVIMSSDDETQTKVVRYSGSTEKQTIQYDDEGKPLYSGNNYIKYISENRNLDICVADCGAGAVMVVSQAGKLRFRYTAHSSTTKNKPFKPHGITTDSQSQILTADPYNHCIYILDQNGQFLRYIDNCDLNNPYGLCVDKSDNLFVAEVAMDPRHSAQDVIRCDLCETAIVQMYCDFCHINLCFACIGKHIADDYDKHKVVPFQKRKSTLIYTKCSTHQKNLCKYHCKECDKSVCSLCADNLLSSSEHKGHSFSILSEIYNKRKADITKDSEEIENIISPTYEEMATDLETQITNLNGEYVKFITVVTKHGEEWHKEIDYVINKMKNEIEEMKIKHLEILKKHLDEIKQIQSFIEQSLITLKEMEESKEVSVTMEYRSQNKEFRKLPPKVRVSLPTFSPNTIDGEQLHKSLGSLIPLSFTTDENGYTLKKTETSLKELMDEPELVTTINTGYEKLRSVTCLSEEEFWTSRSLVSDMKCFNIQGTVINTIKTKSGKWPCDIAVTSDGDLVYCDRATKTVNKVKSGQTEEVIRLQGWRPSQLCVTSSGDLLVTMFSDDETQSKVVRYSGSIEKQTIQYDDEGKPLYSGNGMIKYISENRNLDICVADCGAGAVVVVNQAGKLQFRYTGHFSTTKNIAFKPHGITTDSQSQILTADRGNDCIHILDQNGQFLHYIDNCDLKDPLGLCVDKSDNLFVAEYSSGNVKKIKHLQ